MLKAEREEFKIMTVYDTTHELARQIKNSREYIEYKEVKDIIYADPKLKEQVEEFDKIRYEVQLLTMQGEKQDEQKMAKLEELYTILLKNKDVKKFFDTQVRFNVMLADVNKIIGEAVKDVLQ
ncbi:MAG: YlbF family regulator [Clostridia bacterium]|nr:YlbF family regulator [Clostridia bacterium]